MKIPVFVSCPTVLSRRQESARNAIVRQLNELGMEPRALGRTDYPTEYPLKEVLVVAKHCCGGIILGFEQFQTKCGTWKRGTNEEFSISQVVAFTTPWNQIEAGILFALNLSILVFKEDLVSGGVFDSGATDVFIHRMPIGRLSAANKTALREVFLNWQRKVRAHYYGD